MDRRTFLKSSSVAATAASVGTASVALAAPALAAPMSAAQLEAEARGAQPFVLAVPQSLAHVEVMTAAHRMAARLQTLFAGTRYVTVETTVESGLEAVLTARADAYLGLESQHASYHPAFQLISSLPIGAELDGMMQHAWLSAGEGRDLWQALAMEQGAVAFPAFHTGPSAGLYAEKLLGDVADLKGARIAARGLAGRMLTSLGADVVTVGDADLKGAIAANNLVAAEPLMAPTAAVAHWSFGPGVTPSGHLLSLGLRASTWERLSPSERVGVEGIAAETAMQSYGAAQLLKATAERIDGWRRWPVHTSFPTALQRDLEEAGWSTVDALGGHDATAARFVASLHAFRKGMSSDGWNRPQAPLIG
jgi:TRAP-type mannitol/chloroaromatic compound transport system substrate-binding protein